MANNRLWIVNQRTGDKILFCKSSGDGWYCDINSRSMQDLHDFLHWDSNDEAGWKGESPTELVLTTDNAPNIPVTTVPFRDRRLMDDS